MSLEDIEMFSSRWREELFLRHAKKPGGATAQNVFEEARSLGDRVTIEAYHNLGRRLTSRGIVTVDKSDRHARYTLVPDGDGQWLDEDQLSAIINPNYPLIALTIVQEATRQLNDVPESVWTEIRERLKGVEARSLFTEAIIGYCESLADEVERYAIVLEATPNASELPNLYQQIENGLSMLKGVVNFGLGLSTSAVRIPRNVAGALEEFKANASIVPWFNRPDLEDELLRRVEDGSVVKILGEIDADPKLFIAAVDGSTRSGVTSPDGKLGDFSIGSYPVVSINTAVCQVNKSVRVGDKMSPAFFRLPEKPEDMQQSDNRHTIMAKVFFPDITDGEYIHSVWNAMDVLESKASLRALQRWYTNKTNTEIRPADILLRDGTVVPQERDFTHYIQQDSYGKITRDLIEANWGIVKKCKDDDQTVAGVVKTANLRVLGPVINWFVSKIPSIDKNSQIKAWPIANLNLLTDQVLLSRMLSASRKRGDAWTRTCIVLRPFSSVTKYAQRYSKLAGKTPAELILKRASEPIAAGESDFGRDDSWLRSPNFRGERDPYVQLLRHCWYAGCYIGALPRLDLNSVLPRCEFVLPFDTAETAAFPNDDVKRHLDRLVTALKTINFDVSAEHSMFLEALKIDVLPSLLISVHDIVKIWAAELVSRVNEYIGYLITRRVAGGAKGGIKVRPWTANELKAWSEQLQMERNLQAGMGRAESNPELPPAEP